MTADVVALNQPFFYNRLGVHNPVGTIYALRHDVEPIDAAQGLVPGNVQLKSYKRPRPIVLRVNAGDCLSITFQNLLNPTADTSNDESATRAAGIHVIGMQAVGSIASDGSNVGKNPSSLTPVGGTQTYTLYAEREGGFLLYSTGATTGGEGNGGTLSTGLFGAVNVEPPGAEWYRSQVTNDDLRQATVGYTPKTFDANGVLASGGQPIINYDAVYASGPRAGLPILKITDANGQIVHSDLNAVITGPNRGRFQGVTLNGYTYYNDTPVNPDRNEPFREFSVIFHDEIVAVQAFPEFSDPVLQYTLHSVRDGFAINYGTGGIGAEILANRKGVGPMANCTECKYEEFFLASWAVGDPAMVVDNPANNPFGLKATQAYFPDDPSNVHHSYINDHVKFRNIHAGPKEHHVFHLHAHQWVQTPDSDNSTYLDSQAIGPGASFTYEITHGGSGNRNKTVGDSIFHCHFYPHFAQGMWELWRSHDVFEDGSRMLPDGEIAGGTPVPALIPLPTDAMAPMPGTMGNLGYPFFASTRGADGLAAAIAGHRPATPPLDISEDGGLPRHVITGCEPGKVCFTHEETRLSFDKTLKAIDAIQVPEGGTANEQAAMRYHAVRNHPSFLPDGATPANFVTNGSNRPPPPGFSVGHHGAPFADPCVDDSGNATGTDRVYKAAAIQIDAKLNKAGWHHPQTRMLSLWGDVSAFLDGSKPPEPFFFRANTNDCITYYHTNLVPNVYKQDDFQIRTPTDILGQHIHLVKFDVEASDGSGNGFNYEDGTLSYEEVQERINAINNGAWTPIAGGPTTLACAPGGPLGTPCARTTIQRWYADATMNLTGKDRTLRTVFTHDHFGPSTHQQGGLYASLVIEPQGSTWMHNEQNVQFGTRDDGGPTSWEARIVTADNSQSYREFMLQFADFQMAYHGPTTENADGSISGNPVNPPARNEVPLTANPPSLQAVAPQCPGGVPRPCPEAISADDIGTMSVNYRNEPIPLRVRDPATNTQAAGDAGDLARVYASNVTRADPAFNVQPAFYPPLIDQVQPGDPFTPLLRAYENDKVQVRVQVGATEEGHNMTIHGQKWLHEPSEPNSGYRDSQMIGISEHFEMVMPALAAAKGGSPFSDYLYKVGASANDQWNGVWGLMRSYAGTANGAGLPALPSNPDGKAPANKVNAASFSGVCPSSAPVRKFDVTAITAQQLLPNGTLVYNSRTNQGGMLHDPTAILYVRSTDLDSTGLKLKPGVPVEPLVLRANAGDCINVSLSNKLPAALPDLPGYYTMPMLIAGAPGEVDFNANQVAPSNSVGLHPQLVTYDVQKADGTNVGFNPVQTAAPGTVAKYTWYAGDIRINPDTSRTATPVEFGIVNLMPADPIKQPSKGAIGALVIEPPGTCPAPTKGANDACGEDAASRAQARFPGKYREFVLMYQNAVNLRRGTGTATDPALPQVAQAEDPEDSANTAFNYRTEPIWKRMGYEPDLPLTGPGGTETFDYSDVLSNAKVGGDPQTPVFTATVGEQVRLLVAHPGGLGRDNVFQVHGHGFQEQPWTNGSTSLGFNPQSEYKGSQYGIGPSASHNFLLGPAGGRAGVVGDFLFRDQPSFDFNQGLWGILRVCAAGGCP
ncbi:MAG TPA: hypothetical protein VFL36_12520 [Myxococcales bacterium]|nr:hypothetical protein [Myxococcales bacterium]